MRIKFSKEKPEILERCEQAFGVKWNHGVIITYGDTIYCKRKLQEPKISHEEVHVRQQKEYGVEEWWNRYFEDEKFRLEQELEAYQAEVDYIRQHIWNIPMRNAMFDKIAMDLSSSMYGNIVTYREVFKLLDLSYEAVKKDQTTYKRRSR
jgi:hypothetical protein